MPRYRVTLRIGRPGRQYDVRDVEANSLRAALREIVERFPEDAEQSDLLEVRRHAEPDERNYSTA